ncbi:MAG TPA: CGNR zinc finger domain-containing protein [Gemmatimonadaceae bacterium]|nr:CGNR zinc finger domain-containing protein [Gemmatimonadaceae bacterium]
MTTIEARTAPVLPVAPAAQDAPSVREPAKSLPFSERSSMTSALRMPEPATQATPVEFARFVGERLWLDFVNSDRAMLGRGKSTDALDDFDTYVAWLGAARVLDGERGTAMLRRAQQQPTAASAALHEARRLRNVLRALAESGGSGDPRAEAAAVSEINRILGRSAGSRRVEPRSDGGFVRSFVTVGDVFAGLLVPVIESAADALVHDELARVRRCAAPRCGRVFYDASRNGKRRWCEMATCGNRAKAARHRRKVRQEDGR